MKAIKLAVRVTGKDLKTLYIIKTEEKEKRNFATIKEFLLSRKRERT